MEVSTLDYRALANDYLTFIHPKEKRRPPTELERDERVQAGTLRYLLEHGKVATPAQLTEFFGFSQARLTKILGELEEAGYIRRERDPEDRRRVNVYLTDSGYQHAAQTYETLLAHMTGVLEALGEEDALHFIRIIKKLSTLKVEPLSPLLLDTLKGNDQC